MDFKKVILNIPDFPKPGILFRDITPVTEDPRSFAAVIDSLAELVNDIPCDRIAAIESRGFVFGGPLALRLQRGLVLLRKAGKLPRETFNEPYDLEYGTSALEVHRASFRAGQKVVVLDDLLATGGTAAAAGRLIRQCGAVVSAYLFLVELSELSGRDVLTDAPVFSLVQYE
jgi:adenine phosphoribosyltransferase